MRMKSVVTADADLKMLNKCKEVSVSHLPTVEDGGTTGGDDLKCSSADVDDLINTADVSLHLQMLLLTRGAQLPGIIHRSRN